MATAWSITTARDPKEVDVTPLIQAMTYKQQNYYANDIDIQSIIDNYTNIDIAKDVDKNYFVDRIKTLVNYINQSGTQDWSRKNLVNEVSSYLNTALDKNVMNAISSTAAFRKQQAEIAEIKKNKPELYSVQNEWLATQDWARYMSSTEVGDRYRPLDYKPYLDVNKKVLEYADKLKDANIEYYIDQNSFDGLGYFRSIITGERVSPHKIQNMLNTILDPAMMDQLYIDAQYTHRNSSKEDLLQAANSNKKAMIDAIDESLKDLILKKNGEQDVNKIKDYEAAIKSYENQKKSYEKLNFDNLSRDALIQNLYTDNWMNKWTNQLSYNRVKDFKIDDSGYKIARFEFDKKAHDEKMDIERQKLDISKKQLKATYDVNGLSYDSDTGKVNLDPNNPKNGITMTEDPVLNEFKETTFKNINDTFRSSRDSVINHINEYYNDPGNVAEKKSIMKEFANYNIDDDNFATVLANKLLNSKQTRNKYAHIFSGNDEAQKSLDSYIKNGSAIKDMMSNSNEIIGNMVKEVGKLYEKGNEYTLIKTYETSTDDLSVKEDGTIVSGNIARKAGSLDDTIRSFNSVLLQTDGRNLEYQRALFRKYLNENTNLSKDKINTLMDKVVYGGKSYDNAWFKKKTHYALSTLGNALKSFIPEGGYNVNQNEDYKDYAATRQLANAIQKQAEIVYNKHFERINRKKLINIDPNAPNFNLVTRSMKQYLTQNGLQYELYKDHPIQLRENKDGTYTIIASVKSTARDGNSSGYVKKEFAMPKGSLDQFLAEKLIDTNDSIYNAKNAYSTEYSASFTIPKDKKEFYEYNQKVNGRNIDKQMQLINAYGSGNLMSSDQIVNQYLNIYSDVLARLSDDERRQVIKEIKDIANATLTLKSDKVDSGNNWVFNIYDGDVLVDTTNLKTQVYDPTKVNNDLYSVIQESISKRIELVLKNLMLNNDF